MRRLLLLCGLLMAGSAALAQQPAAPKPEAPQAQPAPGAEPSPQTQPPQGQPAPPSQPQQGQPQQGQVQQGFRPLVEREFKTRPGQEVRIGVFTNIKPDCTADQLPAVKLGEQPRHGQVTVRQGKVRLTNHRQCLAAEVPAFVAFYRARPDFPGKDVLTLEVRDKNGRLQVQRITITSGAGKPVGDSI